jgi:HlyD family secretion protein
MKIKLTSFSIIVMLFMYGCGNSNNEQSIELSGIIESTDVNITAKVSGEIRKVNYDEGSVVKTNDTLVELDRETVLLQQRQLQAGVALSEAQYQLSVNGFRNEDIHSAEETMKQAKSNFDLADYDKHNMESLYKSGSISEKQWKDILTRFNTSKAQYKSSEEMYNKMKRGNRAEDISAAKARLEQSKAQLELVEKQLRDSYIISPVNGTITHKVFELGELVNVGSTVYTITQLDKVYLMVYVSEQNLGKVKYGQTSEIKIDSYPDRTFTGKVTYISSIAEFTPKNIQTKEDRLKQVFGVKLEIDNKENILKPGMPADAKILISK